MAHSARATAHPDLPPGGTSSTSPRHSRWNRYAFAEGIRSRQRSECSVTFDRAYIAAAGLRHSRGPIAFCSGKRGWMRLAGKTPSMGWTRGSSSLQGVEPVVQTTVSGPSKMVRLMTSVRASVRAVAHAFRREKKRPRGVGKIGFDPLAGQDVSPFVGIRMGMGRDRVAGLELPQNGDTARGLVLVQHHELDPFVRARLPSLVAGLCDVGEHGSQSRLLDFAFSRTPGTKQLPACFVLAIECAEAIGRKHGAE